LNSHPFQMPGDLRRVRSESRMMVSPVCTNSAAALPILIFSSRCRVSLVPMRIVLSGLQASNGSAVRSHYCADRSECVEVIADREGRNREPPNHVRDSYLPILVDEVQYTSPPFCEQTSFAGHAPCPRTKYRACLSFRSNTKV
jgi:hypothetical protein